MIHNHVVQIYDFKACCAKFRKCKKQHTLSTVANKSLRYLYLRISAFHLRFMKHQLVNQTNEIIAGRTYIHACMLGEEKKEKTDVVSRKYHTETDLTSDKLTFMCNFSA